MSSWADLRRELAQWETERLSVPLWWRDDDAVADTAALRHLERMTTKCCMPLFIAAIPAHLDPSLPDWIARQSAVFPVVHGWAHQNHETPPTKKAEFGTARDLDSVVSDATRGLEVLKQAFGQRLCPIFVPPWNRIRPDLPAELGPLGYRAVSTFTPRAAEFAAPGVAQINTHIDPIDWRGSRSLVEESQLLSTVITLLHKRRIGHADNSEPLGLLTHHLVHDAAIWSFCARLTDLLLTGPATPWQPGKDLTT